MAKRRTFIADTNLTSVFQPKEDDSFDECMDGFIRTLIANRRSSHTVDYYRKCLRVLTQVLREQGYPTRLRRITESVLVEGYIKYSTEVKRMRETSIQTNLRAFRAFFNWAVSSGIIEESPMKNIRIGKAKVAAVETFTSEQIIELLSQPNLETFVGLRDYTIMVTLLETGIRLRELVDVELGDVRFNDSQILIHGKNGHDRLVPFQARMAKVLRKYINIRGKSETEALFITHDDGKMSRKAVQDRLAKYGRMAMIENVRCSPHTFRHTFAKMSVRNGANIFALQKILGHSTMDMVRTYVNLFSTEVNEEHRRFSPLENLYRRS